jgi:hypothetical protein
MSGVPGTYAIVSELDPVGYIRHIGLRPEDSYGFIPVKLDEGSPTLYLYRDRPEYDTARATPAGPRMPMMQPQAPGGGMFGDLIEQAQELQQMYGGAAYSPGVAGDPMPAMPDVEKLAEAAKLRASGAIDDAEYARLRAEAGVPDPGAAPSAPAEEDPGKGPPIVAHRMYPGVRSRSSTMQLDHFLPRYCETVGLRSQDVYGVFPWYSRTSSSGPNSAGSTEWDDFWIVYRDRPEYAAGRDAYASAMDDKGRWPDPVTAPGVSEPSGSSSGGGNVEVDRERWPRAMLVIKQTGGELADSVEEKIAARGYAPEDSFGFCPNFEQSSIYFGWRAG